MAAATKKRILDVAEAQFADQGYAGTSLRTIGDLAEMRQSLVSYHFGSKSNLFVAVIERRASVLAAARERRLAELSAAVGPPDLERVLRAFIEPYLKFMLDGGTGWRNYGRLIAQIANTNYGEFDLVSELFDPTARKFIAALHEALPAASEEEIVWGFTFLLGTMLHVFAQTERVLGLTSGRYDPRDLDRICAHMIPFLAAGLRHCRAPVPTPQSERLETVE